MHYFLETYRRLTAQRDQNQERRRVLRERIEEDQRELEFLDKELERLYDSIRAMENTYLEMERVQRNVGR